MEKHPLGGEERSAGGSIHFKRANHPMALWTAEATGDTGVAKSPQYVIPHACVEGGKMGPPPALSAHSPILSRATRCRLIVFLGLCKMR